MSENESSSELLMKIEEAQERLRQLLSGQDEKVLAERPANGNWSVLENVRHLLFAEQAHIGQLLSVPQPWSPFGLAHAGIQKKLPVVGSAQPSSVQEVLEAWQTTHSQVGELAEQDSEQVRRALYGNFRHLLGHTKVIERLLRAHSRAKARAR
jgi:DinB superfamily